MRTAPLVSAPPELAPSAPDEARREEIDGLNEAAWRLRRNDPKKACAWGEKAHAEARALDYPSGQAYGLLVMGYGHIRLSEPALALEESGAALALFERLGDKEGARRALNTLGIIYGESGRVPKALETFLALETLCAELGDKKAEGDALNNAGVAYLYLGDLSSALDYHLRALKIFQAHGFGDGVIYTFLNLGTVQQELGRPADALKYFLKSLNTGEEPDAYTQVYITKNIGRTYLKLGDFERSLLNSRKSLALMEELGDRLGASYTLDDLGLTYMQMGRLGEAEDYLNKSLSVKKELGDKKGEAETCIHLGCLYLQQGELERALATSHEGLASAEAAEAKTEAYRAHQALAEAYEQNRQFREATIHLKRYTQIKDEVFNEKSDRRLQGLQVRFEVEQTVKEKEIYRLKNVELAEAVGKLRALTASLQKANEDKTALLARLEVQACEDDLTGVYNRRYFDAKLEEEFKRAARYSSPMSVMICDIDNFKRVNDDFSHQVGDEVLRRVAGIFKARVRGVDTVARYGGEEFVILFPQTPLGEAAEVSERIREAVAAAPWHEVAPGLRVTISAGMSDDLSVPNHEKLVGLADAKLYEAKRSGKNRVVI